MHINIFRISTSTPLSSIFPQSPSEGGRIFYALCWYILLEYHVERDNIYSNWTDFSPIDWTTEGLHKRQTSLLRPVKPGRSCKSMEVGDLYCLCKIREESVPFNDSIAIAAAQFLTSQLMEEVEQSGARHICADLSFSKVKQAVRRTIDETSEGTYTSYSCKLYLWRTST